MNAKSESTPNDHAWKEQACRYSHTLCCDKQHIPDGCELEHIQKGIFDFVVHQSTDDCAFRVHVNGSLGIVRVRWAGEGEVVFVFNILIDWIANWTCC